MNWRKIIAWTAAALGILIVFGIVGGLLFLRTNAFRRMAIRTIIQDTNTATGGRAQIGNFDFHLSTLTAHLYNITLHGTEAAGQPPLLQVDKITVALKIQSILQRKVTLAQLEIEHPVANMRVDRDGKSNLPKSPQKQNSSNTNIFDLAAGHVLVADGQVNYNDKSIPVDVDLYGLRTEIHYVPAETRYRGTISYDHGNLRYAADAPFSHSLEVRFNATPSQLSLDSAVLKVGSSALSLQANLTNYSNPAIEGRYDLRIHAQDFSGISQPVTPAGDVSLAGSIHYQGSDGHSLLQSVLLDGRIASEGIAAASAQGRIDLRRLQGQYKFANGTLQANDVTFETLGGKLSTEIKLEHLDKTVGAQLQAKFQGISLQSAQQAFRLARVQNQSLTGRLNGSADASWTGSISSLQARADLNVTSSPGEPTRKSSQTIPVDGFIHVSYDGDRNRATFRGTSLRISSTTVAIQGEVSDRSNLQVQLDAGDLHELAQLISVVSGKSNATEVAGSAMLKASVLGSLQKPQITGQWNAQNLRVQGSDWRTAQGSFQANPSQITLRDVSLVSAHQGKASLNASATLRKWAYVSSDPITVNLSIQRMSIVDLQHLANLNYPVSGDLSVDVSLHGSQLNPVGSGSAKIENANAYDEPIQHFAATFRADKNSVTSTLEVSSPAGSARGSASYTPRGKAYVVRLDAPSIVLQKIQMVQRKNMGLAGTATISASGQGNLDTPQLEASVYIPQLQIHDKSISQIKAQLRVANQRAELSLDSQVAQASVRSHANVSLTGDYYADASIDTTGVPLDPLLALYLPSTPQGFQGETELHATLKGPLKDKSRMEAHLTIPTLKASYQSLEVGAASPIHVDYANSLVTLQPADIRGTGTSLRLQGTMPIGGNAAPSLTAQGSIDVRILKIVAPDVESSGTVSMDIHASGTAANPTVEGQLHVQNVAMSTPSAPLGVENLNGTLAIVNNSLQLSGLTGEVGGGQVSAGGSIGYRPNLEFNVSLQSKSVRLRYPDGLRALLDGNLILSGTQNAATLNGRVLIDTLSFTPDFDLSKFSDQFGGSTIPSAPGLADNIRLAVALQSKNNLSATSSQISLEGQVNLQVVGTAANPVIVGRTDLTSGELFYRNVRYQLQRGIITFDNPSETEPTLNVTATTTIEQYNLTLTLRGPFDRLTTTYTSDPPLATADVINLIANGKTTSEANAAGQTTDSMIASQVASQVTGGIQHLAGISSLQIDPLLGGNNQNPSARVAIQQRVTKNFLFTFSTDLSQPGTEIVQGDYQINQRWSVSLTRDEVGGVSVDGKYHTKF
jgi:translocation and assembly module TamB